ncbi:ComEC/Rec2 family competence protein [Flavobacterium laiguense]|uniref:Competence protein ComEC n=1 Tax=Flavobacterium laiguense TaxID=2169409 RepID=A0A2U1JPA3_9FLAO|nr:ComEC/Rec2 family competence protein [Flavobacterium laiguense]PWA06997.1 competence protein ComEC [Flavobacterium laiguense]
MKVLQFPLARITAAFILGILVVYSIIPSPLIVFILLSISALLFIITYYLSITNSKFSLIFGIATSLLAFSIGGTTQIIHTGSYSPNNYTNNRNICKKNHTFTVTLREKLKSSNFSERYIALLHTIDKKKAAGRILLNIRKDSLKHTFEIGNRLKINGILYKNTAQKNPNQFDYQKYLDNKQIYAQLYAEPNEIQVSTVIEKDIWYYASKLRTRIIQNLNNSNFHAAELNVAVALILGQQQDIDPNIIRDYQYAGAVHILSVSGLHIGFILLFITFVLKPLPNSKRGSFIKLIVTLLSLSLFGILAGLAPSVLRSVTMFSFVAIGLFLRRSVNIYHTLLVSILLILLFQPYFLFDVGFQLSYIALFFIIWLQPLLAMLCTPKSKVQKYIWDLLTVSFAAQIGTLPLSIYYFHQFPGLFFMTNLIVIPFLGFIMSLGVLVMVLAAFNWVPFYPAKALEISIFYLDKIINTIASFESFIIKDIPLNTSLLLTGYLVLIAMVIWFKKPNFKSLALALISIVALQISSIKTKWDVQSQEEFVVFNTKKNTLLLERNGFTTTLYANDSLLKTYEKNNLISSYLSGNFCTLKHKRKLENTIYFKGNKILILDSSMVYPKTIQPDVLLLTQSTRVNLDRVLQSIKPKIIIADGSNYKTIQKRWKQTCEQQKIPFHSTSEKGFYTIN